MDVTAARDSAGLMGCGFVFAPRPPPLLILFNLPECVGWYGRNAAGAGGGGGGGGGGGVHLSFITYLRKQREGEEVEITLSLIHQQVSLSLSV